LKVKPGGGFVLGFDLESVDGLKQARLIGGGAVITTETLHNAPRHARVDFPLTTPRSTWYSLTVEDIQGHKAHTDPIWVDASP
jgi:hypothetical protein